MGRAPGLDLKEIPYSSNSLQPFLLSFGYNTFPAMLPPYWGIPKFPIALSCVPLMLSGDVTVKLFFSTTNFAIDGGGERNSARNPRKTHSEDLRSFILGTPRERSALGFPNSKMGRLQRSLLGRKKGKN